MSATGAFGWKRQMGVHEAYHQALHNRLVHWVCIPSELLAVAALLAAIRLGPLHDAALVAVILLVPIYLATEPLLGALMIAFLAGCRWLGLQALAVSVPATAVGAISIVVGSKSLKLPQPTRVSPSSASTARVSLGSTLNPSYASCTVP